MTQSNDGYLAQMEKKCKDFAAISSKGNMSEDLATVSVDGADNFTARIMWMATLCNHDVCPFRTQTNAITLMEDSGATEGSVDPVILPDIRDEFIDYNVLDPRGRLTGIGNSIVEADAKGKMVILTDVRSRKLNVPIPMSDVMSITSPSLGDRHALRTEQDPSLPWKYNYSIETRRGRLRVVLLTHRARLVSVCGRQHQHI